jgi:hypothetical protein
MTASTGGKLRVMFDTNAYDAILSAGDEARIAALAAAGGIAIITTPVQEDEIRQIRNHPRQESLLGLLRRLGGERIDPATVIASDVTHMSRDEILARVAQACCDMLVTEDKAVAAATAIATSYAARSLAPRSAERGKTARLGIGAAAQDGKARLHRLDFRLL